MAAPPSPEALARLPDAELERLPTAVLDRAAFGFASGDVIELPVHQIHIRYADDLENAQHEVRTEAQARRYLEVAKKQPVEVDFRRGQFELGDGHHRYVSAVMLKRSTLLARIRIEDNPITALRRQFPQARDCGCASAIESADAEREGARDDEERFVFGWDYGSYDVKGNRHVLEQLARRFPYSGPALRGGSATPKPPVSWVKDRSHLLHYWRHVGVPRHRIDAYEAEVAGALDVSTLAAAVAQRTHGLLRERAEKLQSFGEVVTLDVPPMRRIGQIVQDGYGGDVTLERFASEEAEEARRATTTRFYHGSFDDLPVGTVLRGRVGSDLPVEQLFERLRPSSMVSRDRAVFMVQQVNGIEEAGGGAGGDFVYEVEPIGQVSGPFHGGWHAEVAKLYLDRFRDRRRFETVPAPFVRMLDAYWRGQPCRGDLCAGAWEWITPEARILRKLAVTDRE